MTSRKTHRRKWAPEPQNVTKGTCVCGKMSHVSRKLARQFARKYPGSPQSPYECVYEGGWGWHLGELPSQVKTGDLGREEILPPNPRDPRIRPEWRHVQR